MGKLRKRLRIAQRVQRVLNKTPTLRVQCAHKLHQILFHGGAMYLAAHRRKDWEFDRALTALADAHQLRCFRVMQAWKTADPRKGVYHKELPEKMRQLRRQLLEAKEADHKQVPTMALVEQRPYLASAIKEKLIKTITEGCQEFWKYDYPKDPKARRRYIADIKVNTQVHRDDYAYAYSETQVMSIGGRGRFKLKMCGLNWYFNAYRTGITEADGLPILAFNQRYMSKTGLEYKVLVLARSALRGYEIKLAVIHRPDSGTWCKFWDNKVDGRTWRIKRME